MKGSNAALPLFLLLQKAGPVRCFTLAAWDARCFPRRRGSPSCLGATSEGAGAHQSHSTGTHSETRDGSPLFAPQNGFEGPPLNGQPTTFRLAPPMSLAKYMTMRSKRVEVVFAYTGGAGLKPYFQAATKAIKKLHPDVLVSRDLIEASSVRAETVFDILVDGKVVYQKRRDRSVVHLRMAAISSAIQKARRRRRPGGIVYGDPDTFGAANAAAATAAPLQQQIQQQQPEKQQAAAIKQQQQQQQRLKALATQQRESQHGDAERHQQKGVTRVASAKNGPAQSSNGKRA